MIHIFFRTSNHKKLEGRPEWFSFDRCWDNLVETKENCSLTVIHDGELDKEYSEADVVWQIDSSTILPVLTADWEANNDTYIDHDEMGRKYEKRVEAPDLEKASGYLMYDFIYTNIDHMKDDDIIYIVEDDYLHLRGWPAVVENLYSIYQDLNYFTLYDHPDKYSQRYAGLSTTLLMSNYCHWRTVPSTCGTFGGRKKDWVEDKQIHHYDLGDHNKFLKLNQKKKHILSAVPGLATHCVNGWVAPFRDWANV